MHTALRLSFSSFPCRISIPMHPSSGPRHGRLLFPHSTESFSWVKVMSWSRNCPHIMVRWVKSVVVLSSLPVELTNTILLTFRAFGRGLVFDPKLRGACFLSLYTGGRRRENGRWALPLVTLHKLLHEPSNVRYRRIKQLSWMSSDTDSQGPAIIDSRTRRVNELPPSEG